MPPEVDLSFASRPTLGAKPSAISIQNLGKQYCLTHGDDRALYRTLRESVMSAATAPLRRLRARPVPKTEDFWALRDLSLEVPAGEVLGVIGRNGAGKSTLLKILSRITKPTTGEVSLRGRVGSLLEVGTGFHPELTGRENIYLNGGILGMSRAEIGRKFDEIVEFAEVAPFLDMPVKRFSSGMYVRLGFAVAAFLEPEILLIDEVLAVGDAEFQKKCVGRMRSISQSGRTILFVSHNFASVEALCPNSIMLEAGRMVRYGPTPEVLGYYNSRRLAASETGVALANHSGRRAGYARSMKSVRLTDADGTPVAGVTMGGSLVIHVDFQTSLSMNHPVLGFIVKTALGSPLLGNNNRVVPGFDFNVSRASGTIACRIDRLPLMPGIYWIDLWLGDSHRDIDVIDDAISFEVLTADVFGSGKLPPAISGPICWPAAWTLT